MRAIKQLRTLRCSFPARPYGRRRIRLRCHIRRKTHLLRMRGCTPTRGIERPEQTLRWVCLGRRQTDHNMDGREAHGCFAKLALQAHAQLMGSQRQQLQVHPRSRLPRCAVVWPRLGRNCHRLAPDEEQVKPHTVRSAKANHVTTETPPSRPCQQQRACKAHTVRSSKEVLEK